MSMDDENFIWAWSIHKVVHRYDPRSGKVEKVAMPYQATANSCICVGKKVYILGQTDVKLPCPCVCHSWAANRDRVFAECRRPPPTCASADTLLLSH